VGQQGKEDTRGGKRQARVLYLDPILPLQLCCAHREVIFAILCLAISTTRLLEAHKNKIGEGRYDIENYAVGGGHHRLVL
jgi:hypothetical protein